MTPRYVSRDTLRTTLSITFQVFLLRVWFFLYSSYLFIYLQNLFLAAGIATRYGLNDTGFEHLWGGVW